MLSKRGLVDDGETGQCLRVCRSCARHISRQPLKDKRAQPPKFAIANGLYIGIFPEEVHKEVTAWELSLMTPFHRVGSVRRVRGSPTGVLQGHRVSFFLDTETVVNALPLRPDQILDKVILTGWFTSKQQAAMMKPREVNPKNLRRIL